ncbi:hypothetical protein BX666DRAFT_1576056 [Dichotomocladium elegans]|nr:hypothetical protein BX666DRAFT_1576056 [Dichotomocladium elegans]
MQKIEEKERQFQLQQQNQLSMTDVKDELEEKERMIRDKDKQLEELQAKWKEEQAALAKPVLEQVTDQLDELKKANEEAVARLAEKEKELAVLRAQVRRRDRSPKKGDEDQKRLNRLTMDLESDRLMIQKLEELNLQLEAQKQKHEAILQSHAEEMAEKDRELCMKQKSLADLKLAQERAIKSLEQAQQQTIRELKLKHDQDTRGLQERLDNIERRAKSDMNTEVEKLLQEFEQSEHDHSVQLADLQKSHQEQMSAMRQGQQAELMKLTLRKAGTNIQSSKVVRWPAMMQQQQQDIELVPRDPSTVQIYVSSVSANPTIKRNEDALQKALNAKQIKFQVVDVAQSEPALQHMRRQQQQGANKGLPQVFVGGEYRGQYEDIAKAIDTNTLADLLRPREKLSVSTTTTTKKHQLPRKASHSGSMSSNEPVTPTTNIAPPVPIRKSLKDEDEDLLREIEKELAQSDFAKVDFNF